MELSEELNADFKDSDVAKEVSEIILKSKELSHRTWYELALSCIDLTTLNSTDTYEQGEKIATKVSQFSENYPDLPNVAAICVYPTLVESVRKSLLIPGVKLASVSGGFPSSQTFLDVKVLETMMAVTNGADEIDIVLNLGAFLSQDYKTVINEISTLKSACDQAHLKVILETGALKSYSNIWRGSMLAMEGGADFIKTSTGKLDPAATPEAAWVMCHAIKAYFNKTNRKIGFKAAGGIAETADALIYITIVKEVLGDEWLTSSLFRIGASRLANNLLSIITGNREIYF
jgi:deoxyribose-phosphate aldolase